ncbi:putative transposable element [Trichonephila clavipes]|uniref:Putative transposable element n=1 Tax=Trichonephila clavipes TaxID=2585209 RepID=A0A8X6T013_TRICX|nr:putative transposable element [Trichonephila clavipes]
MIKQGLDSSNEPKTRLPLFPIFISEFCLAMKRTSGRMATSTNKSAAFGVKLIHKFNGDRYRAMITNFFIPELNNHDVQELWFQQDGATCHTAPATIDLLEDKFGDRLISRFGPVNWPQDLVV